jgi:hypothetical protein
MPDRVSGEAVMLLEDFYDSEDTCHVHDAL